MRAQVLSVSKYLWNSDKPWRWIRSSILLWPSAYDNRFRTQVWIWQEKVIPAGGWLRLYWVSCCACRGLDGILSTEMNRHRQSYRRTADQIRSRWCGHPEWVREFSANSALIHRVTYCNAALFVQYSLTSSYNINTASSLLIYTNFDTFFAYKISTLLSNK